MTLNGLTLLQRAQVDLGLGGNQMAGIIKKEC